VHLRFAAVLACVCLLIPGRAAEVAGAVITVSFSDAAGKLTHKLLAKRGSMTGPLWRLQGVEIDYVSAKDPNVIVQRVEAAEATWDGQKEILEGHGRVQVATEENRLTGEGFDFALATSLLHIHRNFRMENGEVVLTSDRATVELIVDRAGNEVKVRDVKRCEAIGHLEVDVQPTAKKSYPFERLFSARAIYDGATQTVTLPEPVRSLKKGSEGTSSRMEIKL
jgi:hypothetical protein